MVPVEVFAIVLWLTFSFVGLSREFPKELGATIGFVGMLLIIDLGGMRAGDVLTQGLGLIGLLPDPALVSWLVVTAIIGVAVFFVYEGEGLVYFGTSPPGPLGTMMDVAIGLFNGWLVIGTWWHYTDLLGYPIASLGWYQPPLSDRAAQLVGITPPAVVPDENSYIYLTAFLLFLLVLKLIR